MSPSQITTAQFNDLAVSKNTQAAISDVLGYANMTKVQEQSIPVCLTGAILSASMVKCNASLAAKSQARKKEGSDQRSTQNILKSLGARDLPLPQPFFFPAAVCMACHVLHSRDQGVDVLAKAKTGTGKTVAFLIPAIERAAKRGNGRGVSALIISPTRELAQQIAGEAQQVRWVWF